MSQPHPTPTIAYATPTEFGRGYFVARGSRALGVTFIAAGGLVLAMCAFLVLAGGGFGRGDSPIAAVIGAGIVALGMHQLSSRPPRLMFNETAFLSTIDGRIEFRWSDLASAQTVTDGDHVTYLILRLADPATFKARSPALEDGPMYFRPREAEHDDIVLPVSSLDVSPERILRQVRGRIAQAHVESHRHTKT